ncbi:hypothetical protein [Halorubrum ezzemoulense]|uniref:hypothetical protein n=1 Tax=Halorubrum ezzemoulense TaxID=337243 RepID=UPI000B795C9E|nr:hypothetical protein [Halorubrum ezzemoulense]
MTADGPDTSRTVDEATLRYVARLFGHQDDVQTTSLFPSNKVESLVVTLDADYYPSDIDEVTLEARVYTNGEFHVSYIERRSGAQRRCRWDRHEQPHSSRDHYHPLPDASTEAAVDRTYPTEFTRVLETTVLPWIDDRVGQLWESV